MRYLRLAVTLFLAAGIAVSGPVTPAGSAIFFFGPAGAEHSRMAAGSAGAAARRWIKRPQSSAEIRAAGSAEASPVQAGGSGKALDDMFLSAARAARDIDTSAFVTALDAAAQSLARLPGPRVLIASFDAPPLSREAEDGVKQIAMYCQSSGVRVVVMDLSEARGGPGAEAFENLANRTGGSVVREAKRLDAAILLASAESNSQADSTQAANVAQLAPLSSDIPVHTRFVRISAMGSQSYGTQRRVTGGRGGLTETSSGAITESTIGPTRGLFLVESPLSSLRFEVDDNAGAYQARAKVTQIARDANGKIAWQASKTVNFRGPLRKLKERQNGNLYYLREVQLPAGQYTLEAIVEDLIASKSGGVREPLRTGRGVRGFDVSDAVLVRPFNGSADRLESDQILAYDGDAIAPLLEPVYEAGKPFDLRLYAILYPDINGGQPELSLEMRQNDRTIGRTALPFTDRIRDTSTEGQGTSMVAEAKHQFPYLATLRGVKLDGGEYEARLLVRQGTTVLTRSARFRVNGPAGQAVTITAPTPGSAQGDAPDEAVANVVLPEVNPVHVTTRGMPAKEQRRVWQEAMDEARTYTSRLPNFRCDRETRRLQSPVRAADQFSEAGSLIEELTFEHGMESYRTLEVDGRKTNTEREQVEGIKSRGEFGGMLTYLFRPDIARDVKWAGRAMSGGVLCSVFEINVPAEKSNFLLSTNLRQAAAAYQGRVMIDEDTGAVKRIVMTATSVPKDFAYQSPVMSLEYGPVRIGEQDQMLPLRSVLQLRQGKRVVRNETLFRNYRKFEADSQIRFR